MSTRRRENEEGKPLEKSMEKFLKRNDKEETEGGIEWFQKIQAEIVKIKREIAEERKEWQEERKRERESWEEERRREREKWEKEKKMEQERREKEWDKERRNWEEEKKEIQDRVRELERKEEMRARKERRNNIVIRGVRWQERNIEAEAEQFLKNELKVEVMVRKARKVGERGQESVTVVEIGEWEKKKEIMEKKKNLSKGVYIDDDLTREEREVQKKLRDRAREEKGRGKRVRVGYRKIRIEDKWYRWNERKGGIEDGGLEERGENEGARRIRKESRS